jgi:hypothetical protein
MGLVVGAGRSARLIVARGKLDMTALGQKADLAKGIRSRQLRAMRRHRGSIYHSPLCFLNTVRRIVRSSSGGCVLKWLRSLPLPIMFAIIGVVTLPIFDAVTGRVWRLLVTDRLVAALLDAAQGMVLLYLFGWYLLRSIGLPRSATSFDYAAASKAKELK